jgi:hypothetical protein
MFSLAVLSKKTAWRSSLLLRRPSRLVVCVQLFALSLGIGAPWVGGACAEGATGQPLEANGPSASKI